MEDEHQDHPPETSATLVSNQNLIIGIVMGAVVLLLLLLVISQQFGDIGDSGNSELADMRRKLKEEKKEMERRRIAGLSGFNASPEGLVTQIKTDVENLARLVNTSKTDAALLRTAQADASALAQTNRDLTNKLAQYQAAAQRAETLQRQLDTERQAGSGMVAESEVKKLRSELELAQAEVVRLRGELSKATSQQGKMVDPNTFALVKVELDQIRQANATLRMENQRLITELAGAKLFVTQDDLSPRAVGLYRELKKLESKDYRERAATYELFKEQVKATVEDTISFKPGSVTIAREHESSLKDIAMQAPGTSFFLVVGYASTSGDSQTNEELFSKRATRVASMVNYLKKEGQGVQAVYLGEGTRFGPEDAPNQVCEVWQIRP
ncbi:MAG: hypothetical protein ACPGJR_15130 [Akkermansiaceae bacterium]